MNYTDSYKRTWGNKDMKSATVDASNDQLVITVDGAVSYTLTLTAKIYTWDDVPRHSELVDEINTKLVGLNATVECYVGGVHKDTKYDCLVFRSTDARNIVSVTGSFATAFFE